MEIVIVGGGYIGMYTARRLERLLRRGEATVTVVDPRGYMTYQPFLAEAAGGSVEPRHVIAPLPRVLRHTRVLTGKIVSIDHARHLAVFAPARGPERVLRYELPGLNSAIYHASYYPCTLDNACHGPLPWGVSWITAMFLHGGWDHILGNMLFLAIFGKNVEDAFGPLRYLAFYFAGGFVAMLTQTAMTLLFGTAPDARVPTLGASGAIAAVLGAYFVLYPGSRVRTWIFPVFLVSIPAWIFLGLWFLYQLIEANFGLFSTSANGGRVAFFAHVGGFVFAGS
jgi:membrane associated rhomboid family serine protease